MKKTTSTSILKIYEPFYQGQESYYHNFDHVKWVVEKGFKILKETDVPKYLIDVFIHGMSCHDAGHKCGFQLDDQENVDISLSIFNQVPTTLSFIETELAKKLIQSTCVPYKLTALEIAEGDVFFEEIIKVARDVDHLGIIGIEKESKRERALIGLFREFARKFSRDYLLKNYKPATEQFFDKIDFQTDYAKKWSRNNLKKMKDWQINFSEKAILHAFK